MSWLWPSLEELPTPSIGKLQRIDVGAKQSILTSKTNKLKAQHSARNNHSSGSHILATIYGEQRLCLLDSGADVCIIPSQYVNVRHLQPTDRKLIAANSTQIVIDGEIRLSVTLGQQQTEAVFVASPNVDEVILGREWLSNNNVVWRFGCNKIELFGQSYSLQAKRYTTVGGNRCVTQ